MVKRLVKLTEAVSHAVPCHPRGTGHREQPRLLVKISTASDMQIRNNTQMAESEEELKSLLMRVKEEGEKASFKLNIQNTMIMASSPITSWKMEEEKVKAVIFYFPGLQNHCGQ